MEENSKLVRFKCDPAITLPRNMSYRDLAQSHKDLDARVFTSGLSVLGIIGENTNITNIHPLRLEKYLKVHLYIICLRTIEGKWGQPSLPVHMAWKDVRGPVVSGEK